MVETLVGILKVLVSHIVPKQIKEHDAAVDFIEGQPVFDQALVFLENGFGIVDIKINQFAVFPASVVLL